MAVRLVNDPKAREKPCLRCGYSLRQLFDARHCPECGLAVWLSLNGDDALERSNPQWLRRLALASTMLATAQALGLAAWAWFSWAHLIELGRRVHVSPVGLALLVVGAYVVLFQIGALLLLRSEKRYPDVTRRLRLALRVVDGLALLIGLYLVGQILWGTFRFGWGRVVLLQVMLAVALVPSQAGTLAYLRRLARRVPSRRADAACFWLLLVPSLMAVAAVPYAGLLLWFAAEGFAAYLPWAYLPASLAVFAWFAATFWRAAAAAERHWSAETAGAAIK